MSRRMGRRSFAKALGLGAGACVLAPVLNRISADAIGAPRVVIVLEGNGVNPGNFLSDASRAALVGAGADISAGDRLLSRNYRHESVVDVRSAGLSSALALGSLAASEGAPSLEEHAAVVLGLSSKISGGGHTSNYGALSCAPSGVRRPSAATFDHVLGQMPEVRRTAPFDVVRLGIHAEDDLSYNTCAGGANQPAAVICNPTTAFYSLFGSVAAGEGAQRFRDRRQLLDFIDRDARRALAAFSGSSTERAKLETYLQSVERLATRHDVIVGMESRLRVAAPEGPDTAPLYESTHKLDQLDVMFELATAALIGCLTNVVVIASGTGERGYNLDYTSLGLESPGRHPICHANDRETLTRVTERHVSLVSRMARTLMEVPEGDGTMLDHTLILYGSDNGEKHHSNAEEWPLLAVGGTALGFAGGDRCVVYPGHGRDENRQLANLYNTVSYLVGSPIDDFGSSVGRIAEGPLSELML